VILLVLFLPGGFVLIRRAPSKKRKPQHRVWPANVRKWQKLSQNIKTRLKTALQAKINLSPLTG